MAPSSTNFSSTRPPSKASRYIVVCGKTVPLLEYIIFIWREDLANKRKPSIIIPIVVFQGKKGLQSKQLHDCFKGIPKEILKYLPNFEFHLTSVHQLPNEKILALEEKSFLRSLFLAYTYYEKKENIENINGIASMAQAIERHDA